MAGVTCELCGEEIAIPVQVLAWVDNHKYHEDCYQQVLGSRSEQSEETVSV